MEQNAKSERYVLNLTPKMVDSLISKTEQAIIDEKKEQSKLDGDLRAAEEMYFSVKGKYDEYQAKINEEMTILEALTRFKKSTAPNKQMQLFKTVSNTKQKVRKIRKPVKWVDLAIDMMKKDQTFRAPAEFVHKIVQSDPNLHHNVNKPYIYQATNYLRTVALNSERGLRMFNDKIGLDEWFTRDQEDNIVIRSQFLTQFMGHEN